VNNNKYAAFSDRYNGPIKHIAQDLGAYRYFMIAEGRYAEYEKGKIYYSGDKGPGVQMHRVWFGQWPTGLFEPREAVIAAIEEKRKAYDLANPPGTRKKTFKKKRV